MSETKKHILAKKLCKYGTIEILKCGEVFTLLLTGSGLTEGAIVNDIQLKVLSVVGDDYPYIEVAKNSDLFFCLILKKKKS